MDYYILYVLGSIFTCSLLFVLPKIHSKKLPPGPTPWPIIGNLHLLGAKPHKSLANLAKIYGPIMSLKLGQITTIVISSSAMAKQVLQKQDLAFSTRFIPDALQAHNHYKFSVPWLPVCTQWRTLRRILNTNILSYNRLDANQHLRSQKVKELLAYCAKCCQQGEAVDVGQVAFKTSLNLLSNTLFSKDLADPFSDSKVELKEVIWSITTEVGKPNLVDFFPIFEKIDPQGIRRRTTICFGKLFKLFDELINERLKEKRRNRGEKSDVLEALLDISAKNPEEIGQNHIKSMFLDLFGAGTDTTTSTLEWAMAEMLRQPEIMRKAQVELGEVIGKGKIVEEADVSQLPYLQCIIKETLRMHPPFPLLVPRKVEQDVELCDYIIPKGSQVLVNAWAIGRDSTFWKDPLVFRPERFWNLDLDMRGKDFELIPFGAGRRICPGLPLALRMVQVMLGSLLNSFNWKLEVGIEAQELNMEEKFGITLAKAHPLRAIPSLVPDLKGH
ncbi:geraniol 8-hydroxylase-like [Nicotiana tabacum]|uniref:Geraniol 8-hydroxylase n=2 Tax=Nicotiana TaxID=4085 RepID=A0A1S4AGN0_TOBAC|nr:PREDICTED: geraniol 8-hydroxylase-like [Nicotiana sylvestris]XP_016475583.1 PREDICTED: geraniol 8-hydroxylase-like [Nicotiana tabacum]